MEEDSTQLQVRLQAMRLAKLEAPGQDEQALLGFAVGAAYALDKAVSLGYADPTGPAVPDYRQELRAVARAIALEEPPDRGSWLAAFYFNAALQRLAALPERIKKYSPNRELISAPEVCDDANSMKHDIDRLLREGRRASLADAMDALVHEVTELDWVFSH